MSEIEKQHYKFFSDLIFKLTSMHYPETEYYRLEKRINELAKKFDCQSIQELVSLYSMSNDKQMEYALINSATNNETFFFRDKKPFDFLSTAAIPEFKENEGKVFFKVWSAACSTGQEPLSIVMEVKEKHPDIMDHFYIDATDICPEAIERSRLGVYSGLEVQRGLPARYLVEYFEQVEGGNWKFKNTIFNKLNYKLLNLVNDPFKMNEYDVIFCRNVLIYQRQEEKQEVITKLYNSLKPNGYLVLGSGESLLGIKSDFKQAMIAGTLVYKKE